MSVSWGQASGPWSEDGKEGKLLPVDPMSPISTGGEERPAYLLRPTIGQKVGHEPQEGGAAAVLFTTVPAAWHRAGLGHDK